MVGPTTSGEDRRELLGRIKAGFALLVGGSMALVAVYGDAGAVGFGVAFLGGTVAGGALAWWLFPETIGVDRGGQR